MITLAQGTLMVSIGGVTVLSIGRDGAVVLNPQWTLASVLASVWQALASIPVK